MAKQRPRKSIAHRQSPVTERDSVYFLKLAFYMVIGAQWLYLTNPNSGQLLPIPLGLLIGLYFTSRESFQIDRKIEYAILLIAMFIGFWLPTGITFKF